MAKWTSYFKYVTPTPDSVKMTDSQEMADAGAYNNYTWYQRLVQGSASRMTRYREYDLMDNDVEVSRALDTIAEELTGNNTKTDDPIDVDILSEDEENIESSAVISLKAAVRLWSQIHDWENKLYNVARMTAKYGDTFFRKGQTPFKPWEFIHAKNVVAAIVDAEDATKIVAWQVKKNVNKPKSGGYSMPLGAKQDSQYETEIVDAKDMVRFTLNDDMSDTAPFGESVLRAVYRSHKQKELLEDAIIIYRVQRAPERRIFYIDVGKMPPQRTKQYLETIKNEIKQKRIPTSQGGQTEVDSVYNPQSMSEDFFFACISLKTNIFLLDGRTLTLEELIEEYQEGKENWTYSVEQKTGRLIPGKIGWAGVTRRNAEMVRIHLDNSETIDCTPDHKFVLKDGTEVEAQNLTTEMSLMPIYKKKCKTNKKQKTELYERIIDNSTGKWTFTHLEICPKQQRKGTVIHHKDYTPSNNSPTNLVELTHEDHWKYHHSPNGHVLGKLWREQQEMMINGINNYHANRTDEQTATLVERNRKNGSNTWIKHEDLVRHGLNKGRQTTRNKFDTYEEYCEYMSNVGRSQWTDKKRMERSIQTKEFNKTTKSYFVDDHLFELFVETFKEGHKSMPLIKKALVTSPTFVSYFKKINADNQHVKNDHDLKFSDKFVYKIVQHGGYPTFKEFKETYAFNHKVIKIEKLPHREDTGCLHVLDPNNNHNFALAAGVYVKNSRPDGRGSKVEQLPGGQGLGELTDLEYFQKKVWRGLKVPASYMVEQSDGGQIWNDGKAGVAYIQELRFSLYIERMQGLIEKTIDHEFKKFLKLSNILIDDQMYRLRLPPPSNFGKYRQFELDSQLLSSYGSADGVQYFSKRFILERFLMLSDEEIIRNERMIREERGLDPDGGKEDYQQIYGSTQEEMGGMGGLGGGGGMGGGLGGMEMGMDAGGMEGGAEGGANALTGDETPAGGETT